MKDWEMIKALTENPKLKAYDATEPSGAYVHFEDDVLVWDGCDQNSQAFNVSIDVENDWEFRED